MEIQTNKYYYLIEYHHPDSFTKNPLNLYSVIHFFEYAILGLFKMIQLKHILSLSISWEFIELFFPYNWARESWLNKLCDLFFNFFGYFFGRQFLNKNNFP